MFADLTFFT